MKPDVRSAIEFVRERVAETVELGGGLGVPPENRGDVMVAFDSDVDWADPKRPAVPRSKTSWASSDELWRSTLDRRPVWLNLAGYQTSPAGGCVIVTMSRDSTTKPLPPGIAFSLGGDAVLSVVGE